MKQLITILLLLLTGIATPGYAQSQLPQSPSPLDTIPQDAITLFRRYSAKPDLATARILEQSHKDKFIKRISLHTNLIDWATLVPNIGIEFDLSQTPRTQYSIMLKGKANWHALSGKMIYNVAGFTLEGRKYWRTGKYGKTKDYHDEFVRIVTNSKNAAYYNADTLAGIKYYNDGLARRAKQEGVHMSSIRETPDMSQAQRDSLDFADDSLGTKQSKFRRWLYNNYHKIRRNITSGRTLDNPRNWRAYYLGVWAGFDNYSVALNGRGKQGIGFGAGILGGYTIPLFPQKYPREGSLDLDLGVAIGIMAVRYCDYTYDSYSKHYVHTPHPNFTSCSGFKIAPYPVLHDVHVSLVWRWRGIKHKVDRSLIDDFAKVVTQYNQRANDANNYQEKVKRQREELQQLLKDKTRENKETGDFWDAFHRRRLEAARRLNPDTVFTGEDQKLYLRLFQGISEADQAKYLEEQAKQKLKDDKEQAAAQAKAQKEAEKKEKAEKTEKPEKPDKKEKKDKPTKSKKVKQDKKTNNSDTPETPEKAEKAENPETPENPEKTENPETPETPENPETPEKSETPTP